jgi:hypothetical protein
MAKAKKQSSAKRRIHSSIDKLPRELVSAVNAMIIGERWPADLKNHYNGKPRYKDIIDYCKGKGYKITNSALGRYALKIIPFFDQGVSDLDSIWLVGVATICKDYCQVIDDMIDRIVGRYPEAEALPRIRGAAIARLKYLSRAIQAIKPLEIGGAGILAGKR